jgi:hypothetical protein
VVVAVVVAVVVEVVVVFVFVVSILSFCPLFGAPPPLFPCSPSSVDIGRTVLSPSVPVTSLSFELPWESVCGSGSLLPFTLLAGELAPCPVFTSCCFAPPSAPVLFSPVGGGPVVCSSESTGLVSSVCVLFEFSVLLATPVISEEFPSGAELTSPPCESVGPVDCEEGEFSGLWGPVAAVALLFGCVSAVWAGPS